MDIQIDRHSARLHQYSRSLIFDKEVFDELFYEPRRWNLVAEDDVCKHTVVSIVQSRCIAIYQYINII